MNQWRHSKLAVVFVVLAMLGLIAGPVLALGCCCASSPAPVTHKAPAHIPPIAKAKTCCPEKAKTSASKQRSQHTYPSAQHVQYATPQNAELLHAALVISHSCRCPHAQASFFVGPSTPQNGVFTSTISTLPARKFSLIAPHSCLLPVADAEFQKPPLFAFFSFSGRAPPVC